MEGVLEFNGYGFAKLNSRFQVDEKESLELFGLRFLAIEPQVCLSEEIEIAKKKGDYQMVSNRPC